MRVDGLHIASVGDPVRHEAAAWFARLRADDVSEREREQFQRWLADDDDHRLAYERLEALWSGLGAHAGRPEIGTALRESQLLQKRAAAATHRPRQRHALAWLAAAALLVMVLAGGWFAWHSRQANVRTYATGVGERRTLLLEDGSRVTMDTDTQLSSSFSAGARRLTLERGRAFFHVAKDPRRPFLVATRSGVVRAVGTQFDVYEHDDVVEVTLVEGRVEVTPENGDRDSHAPPTTMTAGQQLLMGKAYATPLVTTAHTRAALAWLSGKLVFDDTPLPAAVEQFNRYSATRIVIGDGAVAKLRVSGVFRDDDGQAFVDALSGSYGLSVARDGAGNLTLLSGKAVRQGAARKER
jgi:transmembrane sensor